MELLDELLTNAHARDGFAMAFIMLGRTGIADAQRANYSGALGAATIMMSLAFAVSMALVRGVGELVSEEPAARCLNRAVGRRFAALIVVLSVVGVALHTGFGH